MRNAVFYKAEDRLLPYERPSSARVKAAFNDRNDRH